MIMEIPGRTYVKERAEGRDMKEIQSIEFPLWNNYVIYDELVGKHQRNAYTFHLNSGCHTDPGKHIHFLTRIIQLWWIFNHLQSSKFIYKIMLDIACRYLSIMEIRHLLLQLLHLRCPGHSIPVTSVSAEVAHGPPNCTTFTGWPCGGSVSEALKDTPDVIRYDRVIRSMVMLDYHPTLEEWRTSKLLNLGSVPVWVRYSVRLPDITWLTGHITTNRDWWVLVSQNNHGKWIAISSNSNRRI
jgi:hypothetical protein